MKLQPQLLINTPDVFVIWDSSGADEPQLQFCISETTPVPEPLHHASGPSCLPGLAKSDRQARRSYRSCGARQSTRVALCCKNGVLLQSYGVIQQHKAAYASHSASWCSNCPGVDATWLSPSGCWSASAVGGSSSLTMKSMHTATEHHIPGPGFSNNGWRQVFVQDEGIALLALAQYSRQHQQQGMPMVMHLWRQLGSHSDQQHKAWRQLIALPALAQSSSAESTVQATFAQQGFRGLQLCVAHAVPVDADVLLVSVLQQSVYERCSVAQLHAASSSWKSMLINLPGAEPAYSLMLQQQHILGMCSVQLHAVAAAPVSASPCRSPNKAAAGAAAATALGLAAAGSRCPPVLLSWHPAGTRLAVALSTDAAAWITLLKEGVEQVQECCWNNLVEKRATGLLHGGPCHVCSLAWVAGLPDTLAAIDSHGRLCILAGGALEPLQLMDTAGMTVTFKPTLQLHFNNLLAATGSQSSVGNGLHQNFLLAAMPSTAHEPTSTSSSGGNSTLTGSQQRLAIWNGNHLLVCALYHGIDPSQRLIDQSVNARALMLYGEASAKQLTPQQQHQKQLDAEEQGRRLLAVLQPELVGRSGNPDAPMGGTMLLKGLTVFAARGATSSHCSSGHPLAAVARNALLQGSSQPSLLDSSSLAPCQRRGVPSVPADVNTPCEDNDFWLQLADGDEAFLAGRWQDCEDAYKEALPLSAGHVVSLLLCQYRVHEALALIQRLLADVFEAHEAWHNAPGQKQHDPGADLHISAAARASATAGASEHEGRTCNTAAAYGLLQEQQYILRLALQLAGMLTGLTADVLLAAVRDGGGITAAVSAAPKLPCIFPTPMHWTKWLQGSAGQQVHWELTAGMAVELLPGAILSTLAQQVSLTCLQDSSCSTSLHALRDAAARATGLLLLSEVLAAEAEGVSLPDDLPELLTDAVANTALPTAPGGCSSSDYNGRPGVLMWQQAAVLARSCSTVIRELQLSQHLAEAFDVAARSVLWRHLLSHQSQQLPLLSQQAVAVVAVAASLWPVDHPCLQLLTSKVLGLLCRCLTLRVLSMPVLPAASTTSEQPLQHALVQLLLQALPEAAAAAAPAVDSMQHSAQAVLKHRNVQQLLQLLASSQLTANYSDDLVDKAHLASALAASGAAYTPDGLAPQLLKVLITASLDDSDLACKQQQHLELQPAQLAELSGACDIQVLSSAILLVAQAAGSSANEAVYTLQQGCIELAVAAPDEGKGRVRMPVQHTAADGSNQQWLQQEEAGTSIRDAVQLIVNISWLMHCRQQLAESALHSNPEMLPNLAIALAAADGVHKASLVQQAVVSLFVSAECSVTRHHVQQLQSVLDGCCGGALPRTADQLRKLKLDNCKHTDNTVARHWELRCEFLEQLAAAAAGGVAANTKDCGYLPAALRTVHRHGATCIQTHRQAVPGLQACLVYPLAGTPEASATTAKLALAAVLLGRSCLATHRKQPFAGQAGVQEDANLSVDAVQPEMDEADMPDEQIPPAALHAGAAAALQLHAAAAAWQRQYISALQDESLMRDVRAALCSSSRWSIGSFFAGDSTFRPGLLSARSGLCSTRSGKSPHPVKFEDFLFPNSSFVAPAAAVTSASSAIAAAASQSAAPSSCKLAGQHSMGQHKWDNPLAGPSNLDPFFAVYSPLESSRAASPASPDGMCTAPANLSIANLRQWQARRPFTLLTSPGSLQQSQLSPRNQPYRHSLALERLESLHNSAPGSTQASPQSSAGQFSPLHQQLLLHQPSTAASVSRARSLSRSQSSEVWGMGLSMQQRKSSIGAAMDAISPHASLLDASISGSRGSALQQQRLIRRTMTTSNSATAAAEASTDEASKLGCSAVDYEWGLRTTWASLTGPVSATSMTNERSTCSPVTEQQLPEQHSTAGEDGHAVVQLTIRPNKLPDSACAAAYAEKQGTTCSAASGPVSAKQQQLEAIGGRHKPPRLNVTRLSSPAASRKGAPVFGSCSPMDSTEMNSPKSSRQVVSPFSISKPKTLSPGNQCQRHAGLLTSASVAATPQAAKTSAVKARRTTPAAADSRGRPLGEATERVQREGLARNMTHTGATMQLMCQIKQRTSNRWLQKLKQACRWPDSSKDCCQVEVVLQPSVASSISSARQPGPLAEGIESDTATAGTSSSVSGVSSAVPGHTAGAAAGCNLAAPANDMTAAAAAPSFKALPVLPAAVCGPSSGFGSMLGSTSSSPHTLNADAQQRLDEIFKAHLPEFLDILSQGLSPVKEPSCLGAQGPGKHRDASPTIQRSFSAAELSRAQLSDGSRPRDNFMLLSAENAASLWTQAPGISEPYSSSRCSSSGSVAVDQPRVLPSPQQQREVQSAATAGQQRCLWPLEARATQPTAALSWQPTVAEGLHSHRASLQVSSTAAVHIPPAAPGPNHSNKGPLLPIQCQPLGMGAAGLGLSSVWRLHAVPVAEGAENDDEPRTPGSCGSGAYAPYDAYEPPHPVASAAPTAADSMASQQLCHSGIRCSADFDNIPRMMQRAHTMVMSSAPASAEAALAKLHYADMRTSRGQQPDSSAPAVMAAAVSMANGLGADSIWEDPEAAVTEDFNDQLDLTDFMGCFSPVAGSRQLSRVASRNAAAAAATNSPGGIFARSSATASNSLQGSPRVSSSNSLPDMTAFWADPYSHDPSRAISRQVSADAASPQCNNPSYVNAQPQQVQEQSGRVSDDSGVVLAGLGNATPGSKVQYTPSPSRKSSMLLHGPSRLSWKSSAGAADIRTAVSAAVGPVAGTDTAVKAAVAAAVASVLRQNNNVPSAEAAACESEQGDVAHAAEVLNREAAGQTLQEGQQQQTLDEMATVQSQQLEQLGPHQQQVSQQQQTAQHSDKPLLKRTLFGRKGLHNEDRSRELQQVVLQEYKPLQNAVAKLPVQQAQQDKEQLVAPKKFGGFFSFLRSSSGSGSKNKQPQSSSSGVVSCPGTPITATADAAAAGSSLFNFTGVAGVTQTSPPHAPAGQRAAPLQASSCPVSPVSGVPTTIPAVCSLKAAGHTGEAGAEAAAAAEAPATQRQSLTIRDRHQQLLETAQPVQLAQPGAASCEKSGHTKAHLPAGTLAAEAPKLAVSAGTGQCSPAVDILASSMQRIAGFLEELLADCSPAKALHAGGDLNPGTVARATITAEPAAFAVRCSAQSPAATYGSNAKATVGPSASSNFTGWVQGSWSPAAAAAKARIMRSSANLLHESEPSDLVHRQITQQHLLRPQPQLPVADSVAALEAEASVAPAVAAQGGTTAAVTGSHWLHPSSLQPSRPTTVIQAAAASNCTILARQDAPLHGQQARVDVTLAGAGMPAAAEHCEDAIQLQGLAARAAGIVLLRSSSPLAADSRPNQLQKETPQSVCCTTTGPLPIMACVAHEQHETARLSNQQQQQEASPRMATRTDAKHILKALKQGSPEKHSPVTQQECQPLHKHSSPSQLAVLQRMHAPSSAAPAPAARARSMWQRQVQQAAVYSGTSSSTDSEDDWQDMQFQDHSSFLLKPDVTPEWLQQAALQQGLPPAGMGTHDPVIHTQQLERDNVTAASARCFMAAADVKLLQAEKVANIRLLRPSQLATAQPAPQQRQQHTKSTVQQGQQHTKSTVQQSMGSRSRHQRDAPQGHTASSDLGFDSYQRSRHSEPTLVRFPAQQTTHTLQPPALLETLHHPGAQQQGQQQKADRTIQTEQQQLWAGGLQQGRPVAPWSSCYPSNASGGAATQSVIIDVPPSAAAGSTYTGGLAAGRRAAQLLQSLKRQKQKQGQSSTYDFRQTGAAQQQQQHLAPWHQQARDGAGVTVEVCTHHHQGGHDEVSLPHQLSNCQTSVALAAAASDATATAAADQSSAAAAVDSTPMVGSSCAAGESAVWQRHKQQPHSPMRKHKLHGRHPAISGSTPSPARSPKKLTGMNTKWKLLQQLKARNRANRRGKAEQAAAQNAVAVTPQHDTPATDGSGAADSLIMQLQGLMQGPVAASSCSAQAQQQVDNGFTTNLDAAVASALQGVLEHALLMHQNQSLSPQQQPTAAVRQTLLHDQTAENLSAGKAGLADSISFGDIGSKFEQQQQHLVGDDSHMQVQEPVVPGSQQPLLLPRMLSRAPLLDAEVQAGGMHLLLQQQTSMAATQTAPAEEREPVKVVLRVEQDQSTSNAPHQQQQAPMSPAALVALAAAAGAGAASAVQAAAPTGVLPRVASASFKAAAPEAALDQQRDAPKHKGVLELAQLILTAFESSGGVIRPSIGDDTLFLPDNRAGSASAPVVGTGSTSRVSALHELLPNPLAGLAAPHFVHVMDFTPGGLSMQGLHAGSFSDAVPAVAPQQQQQWQQQEAYAQQQSLPAQHAATSATGLNLGCCFAACPERMSSPTFKGSPGGTSLHGLGLKAVARQGMQGQHKDQGSAKRAACSIRSRPSSSTMHTASGSESLHQLSKAGKASNSKQHSGRSRHDHHCRHARHMLGAGAGQPQQQGALSPGPAGGGAHAGSPAIQRSTAPLTEWRAAQTQQLDQLWQQWQQQQCQAQLRQQEQQQTSSQYAPALSKQPLAWQQENMNPNVSLISGAFSRVDTTDEQQGEHLPGWGSCGGREVPDAAPQLQLPASDGNSMLAGVSTSAASVGSFEGGGSSLLATAAARAAAKKLADAEQQLRQQQLAQQSLAEERASLDAALARASAARATAKAAAEKAAAARRERMRAELQDLSRMLQEVDSLAAQMDTEAAEAAAAVDNCSWQHYRAALTGTLTAPPANTSTAVGTVQHVGSFEHTHDDGLLHLREAVLEAGALGDQADALSRSLEGLGSKLKSAVAM